MPTPAQVVEMVSRLFDTSPEAICSDARPHNVCNARHICMYLIMRKLHLSSPETGRALGGKDHTTVLNALNKVAHRMTKDHDFKVLVQSLENQIDFMDRLESVERIDLVEIAKQGAYSRRGVMALNVQQMMSLCAGYLEVAEIAQAGGVLAEYVRGGMTGEQQELARNISDMMNVINNPVHSDLKEQPVDPT